MREVEGLGGGEKMSEFERKLARFGDDTVVECPKCGRRQYLKFANGLKNGWSKCCGYTMPIVFCKANIVEAVREVLGAV
jgi:hypothetical protein